jgi:hypothetical protein
MRTRITSLAALLAFAALPVALAETPPYVPGGTYPSTTYGPSGPYYLQHHASTYEEGAQRGYADVVRSYGMANLLNSEAARNWEQARRDYMENRLKAAQTYFEMRSYNDSYRRSLRSPPLSMDQYVRLARQQAPDRLSVSQLDPFTGSIHWPAPLLRPEYAEYRERIERLFLSRAQGTALVHGQIAKAVEEFQVVLKADIETFKQPEYALARNFLDSLGFESQLVQR